MDRIESNEDQQSVIHSAQMFYLLYGNIFRGIAAAPQ